MWKMFSDNPTQSSAGTNYQPANHLLAQPMRITPPRQNGELIALVEEHLERLTKIDDGALVFNTEKNRVLLKIPYNDRSFDVYVGLPFTKGVTERGTGRTELILGSGEHHIDAMQGQYDGAIRDPRSYGNTIRWINIGDTRAGFIGLDYKEGAPLDAGVANTEADVRFLARTLLDFGYDSRKRLFLLEPPYIKMSQAGERMRKIGKETLQDYVR